MELIIASGTVSGVAQGTVQVSGDLANFAAGPRFLTTPGWRSRSCHDGENAALRALLASGKLGQHSGLPASIIVTTTLQDLEGASGTGLTGGGTLLPMSDVIRLARHAHHYLSIFDKGTALALYHAKRLASPGQRIVLYAKDRGCSALGCDVPGYLCEVHHIDEYASCQTTNMDNLALVCGPHHRLIKPGGWRTRNAKTATPNGSHRRSSTTANAAPIPSTTPKVS
jgi:hypothetical protein